MTAVVDPRETTTDIEDIMLNFQSQRIASFKKDEIAGVQQELLEWYRINRRKLPWRGDHLPNYDTPPEMSGYGTWVSEIMLQQTRVETVVSYWYKWMKTFPTIKDLSLSSPDDVNVIWAGLGYYRRGQLLLKGAQKIMNDYGGCLPEDASELRNIPGIGPYTAGAISSIAYNKVEPLVDGNVMRVFSRLRALQDPLGPKLEKECWTIAKTLIHPHYPGDFNQALMELGAMVCKPTSPSCDTCPVSNYCHARTLAEHVQKNSNSKDSTIEGLPSSVTEFPRKLQKKRPREVALSVGVLRTRSPLLECSHDTGSVSTTTTTTTAIIEKYLFVRRPDSGLLAGQWEFPSSIVWEEDGDRLAPPPEPPAWSTDDLWRPLLEYLTSHLDIRWDSTGVSTAPVGPVTSGKMSRRGGKQSRITVQYETTTTTAPTTASVELESKLSSSSLSTPSLPSPSSPSSSRGSYRICPHVDMNNNIKGNNNTNNCSFFENNIVHVFSHQRHTMHLCVQDVDIAPVISGDINNNSTSMSQSFVAASGAEMKWMSIAEVTDKGITSGVKKIIDSLLTSSSETGSGNTRNRKPKKASDESSSLGSPRKKLKQKLITDSIKS
eukprot:gene4016-7998_t